MIDEKAPEEKTEPQELKEFVKPDYKPILLPDPGRRKPMWLDDHG